MNFLQICQKVDIMAGTQGSFQSVSNPVGAHAVITQAVIDGFLDLQNDRKDFEFMKKAAAFSTNVGTRSYSTSTIFGTQSATDDPYDYFGRWQKLDPYSSYFITDPDDSIKYMVQYVNYEWFKTAFLNPGSVNKRPRYITADPSDNLLFHPTPDKIYTVAADYFLEPLALQGNAMVPYLPSRFHQLLAYMGLERVANHYSNTSIYQRYAGQAAVLFGQLYRDQVPGKSVRLNPVA